MLTIILFLMRTCYSCSTLSDREYQEGKVIAGLIIILSVIFLITSGIKIYRYIFRIGDAVNHSSFSDYFIDGGSSLISTYNIIMLILYAAIFIIACADYISTFI